MFPLEQTQASRIPGASGWRGLARKPWLFLRKSAIGSRWLRGAGVRHLSGDCVLPGPGDPHVIKGGPGFPVCCPKLGRAGCPQQEGGWVSAVPGSSQPHAQAWSLGWGRAGAGVCAPQAVRWPASLWEAGALAALPPGAVSAAPQAPGSLEDPAALSPVEVPWLSGESPCQGPLSSLRWVLGEGGGDDSSVPAAGAASLLCWEGLVRETLPDSLRGGAAPLLQENLQLCPARRQASV